MSEKERNQSLRRNTTNNLPGYRHWSHGERCCHSQAEKKRAWKSPAVTLPYLRVAWPDFFVPHWRKLEGSFSQHPSTPKGRKPINTMRKSPKKMRPTNSSGSPSFLPPYNLIALFSKEQRFFCCSQFQYLLLHLFKPVSLLLISSFGQSNYFSP